MTKSPKDSPSSRLLRVVEEEGLEDLRGVVAAGWKAAKSLFKRSPAMAATEVEIVFAGGLFR
jgi:hypothetical protein